jgi:phage repressor protein C with HTH and peptisase S24 domain
MPSSRRSPSGLGVAVAGHAVVRVRGASMAPTLGDGDLLLVKVDAGIAPGDLVVVRLPGRPGLAVKRAVRMDGDG